MAQRARFVLPLPVRRSRVAEFSVFVPALTLMLSTAFLPLLLTRFSVLLLVLGLLVIAWPVAMLTIGFRTRPWVRLALRQRGIDVCGRCGYLLRGLAEADKVCPECGLNCRDLPQLGERESAHV